jgi:uncharacterized membrane protein
MSTTDNVLLIIITSLLSLLLISIIAVVIMIFKLLSSIRKVVIKAESVIDSVESAADVLKDTQGRLALFKLVRNIMKMVQGSKK